MVTRRGVVLGVAALLGLPGAAAGVKLTVARAQDAGSLQPRAGDRVEVDYEECDGRMAVVGRRLIRADGEIVPLP